METDADEDDLVFFRRCHDNAEASVLQGLLEANDIYCFIQGERHRALLGMLGPYIALNLMVPRSELARAEEVVRDAQQAAKSQET